RDTQSREPSVPQGGVRVSPFCLFDRLKFTINEASDRAFAVRLDPDQQTGCIGSFVMRIGAGLEMLGNALPTFRRIHRTQAFRKRFGISRTAQSQCLVSSQERFDGATQPGPEFNLTRNGALCDLSGEPGVENQS